MSWDNLKVAHERRVNACLAACRSIATHRLEVEDGVCLDALIAAAMVAVEQLRKAVPGPADGSCDCFVCQLEDAVALLTGNRPPYS